MNREMLGDSWFPLLEEEINKSYFEQLRETLREEYNNYRVCPPPQLIFNALQLTPFEEVKVVLLGQDPYPYNDDAMGLAFSSNNPVTPYSLKMIFRELDRDVVRTKNLQEFRQAFPDNNLVSWAKQGVLLLNTVLTVRGEQSNSHKDLGWQEFTTKILQELWIDKKPKVFIAWGTEAQKVFRGWTGEHLVLESGHPASGAHGKDKFSGCNHFSKTNHWLKKQGVQPINWRLDAV